MSLRNGTALSPELEAKFLEPYTYTVQHCTKQIGPRVIEAFNYWLKLPADKLAIIGNIMEMFTNAAILIDDALDNSSLRRGLPVAHQVYGTPLSVNASNYVLFSMLQSLLDGFPPETHSAAVGVFSEQMLRMHQGQGLEMYWRDGQVCPTEEQYLDMIQRKTGCFFGLALGLMQLLSEDRRDYGQLSRLMGMFGQLANDYISVQSSEYAEYKGFADDLTEGKFSFPILHAIRQSPDDQSLLNILKLRTENVPMKKYALSRLEETGSLEYTRKVMNEYLGKALAEVDALGGNPALVSLLEYIKEQQI